MDKKRKELKGITHGGTGHLPASERQRRREERARKRKLAEALQ